MTILSGITWLQSQLRTITGIKSAPDYPGGGILPKIETYIVNGTATPGVPAGAYKYLDNINVELEIASGGSKTEAFKVLEILHPLVLDKILADVTLGGNVETYADVTHATLIGGTEAVPVLFRVYTINQVKTYKC